MKSKLDKYVGQTIVLTLYSKVTLRGELHRVDSDEFLDRPDLYEKKGYYTLTYPNSNTRIGEYVFKAKDASDIKISKEELVTVKPKQKHRTRIVFG